MRESDLWKYVRDGLRGKCHLTRIESSAGNGVPDVSIGVPGGNIWVELKYIPEWPKRPTTKVKLPLRPEQKHWIKTRGELSGGVWVICRVQNDIFLFDHMACKLLCEGALQEDWFFVCEAHWLNRIDFAELYEIFARGKKVLD